MKAETVPPASAVHSVAATTERGNYRRSLSDYRALDRALLADDLAGARVAFARLQEDSPLIAEALSRHPFPPHNSPLHALQELGRHLLTGDLHGARLAFQQFH